MANADINFQVSPADVQRYLYFGHREGQLPLPDAAVATNALIAFAEIVTPLIHNNFALSPQVGFEVWSRLVTNDFRTFVKLGEFVEAFIYVVCFAWGTSYSFLGSVRSIAHCLFSF